MNNRHLSEEQLSQLVDGELRSVDANHLEQCPVCADRLSDLRSAAATFAEYWTNTVLPTLPARSWPTLDMLLQETENSKIIWRNWWIVPGLATVVCLIALRIFVTQHPTTDSARQLGDLLARSSEVSSQSVRAISIRLPGHVVVRPAVLGNTAGGEQSVELAHLQKLFTAANYSWHEPLSARSFQSWRRGLRSKKDAVSVFSAEGVVAYRIRTDTGVGNLRSASLILRGERLRPTNGEFQFVGEPVLDMDDVSQPVVPQTKAPQAIPPETSQEAPASPADALHVLAALNSIGADVGEPIDVREEAHEVVVHASGLSNSSRIQIEDILRRLPRVRMDFQRSPSSLTSKGPGLESVERVTNNMPSQIRQEFEEKLGSPLALQELTDRALEASGLIVARAHALDLLARTFGPQIEETLEIPDKQLLARLRGQHLRALRSSVSLLRKELQPLLPQVAPETKGGVQMIAAAQDFDDSINRVLAGNYPQQSADQMLRTLASQLNRLEEAITQGGKR